MKYIILEHHPNDSRLTIVNDGICQSLTSRMGTGGGNVPIVIAFRKSRRAQDKDVISEDNRKPDDNGE